MDNNPFNQGDPSHPNEDWDKATIIRFRNLELPRRIDVEGGGDLLRRDNFLLPGDPQYERLQRLQRTHIILLDEDSTDCVANNVDSFPEIQAVIKNEDDSQAPNEEVDVFLQRSSVDVIDIKYEFQEIVQPIPKKRRGRQLSSKKASTKPLVGVVGASRKRKKDFIKPPVATAAHKSLPIPTKHVKGIEEPVPSTSSSLSLTKPCTITPLGLDTASNLIWAPPSIVPCSLLATLPLIHNYLDNKNLINCRLVCKVWKRAVDNFLKKRRRCPPSSNTAITEPVPSTSLGLSITNICTATPSIRTDIKLEVVSEHETATIWVDDIGADEEAEERDVKYQPPDDYHLNLEALENLESVPDEKEFLEVLPLLFPYFANETIKFIINCRSVCRPWRNAVDNYFSTCFIKASLSDFQKKTVPNLLYNFLNKFENHLKNPFVGHAINLNLPKGYEAEWHMSRDIQSFFKEFGRQIWTLHIDGNWRSDLPFITDGFLLNVPDIRNLIISKSSCLGRLAVYTSGRHLFKNLERVEISEVSDLASKPLLKRLSQTELKILCVDTLDNFLQFEWPTLKELHLKPKRNLNFEEELPRIRAPQLELLGLDIKFFSSRWEWEATSDLEMEKRKRIIPTSIQIERYVTFNSILKGLQFINSLNTIRFYSTQSWIGCENKFDPKSFVTVQCCPENIKTLEIYDDSLKVKAFGNCCGPCDYSFLLYFPHVAKLKIVQEKSPTRNLSDAARLEEDVKVHRFIYVERMYESDIWERMPALQELIFGRRIYKREAKLILDARISRNKSLAPSMSEPVAFTSSGLPRVAYVPTEKRFLKALPLLFPYFDKQSIIKCRSVCKPWRNSVNNYVTKNFLNASLSDLQSNSTLSNLLYNFPKASPCKNFLNEMKKHSKNPFIGHVVHLHLPTNYPETNTRCKILDFLEQFGKHIWTLHIDGDFGSDPAISSHVFFNVPNVKNLIISKSSCVGILEKYRNGRHLFEFLERVEISEVSDSVSTALLKRLSETRIKILCVDSLKNVIPLKWPTIKVLHLRPKETFSVEEELPSQKTKMKAEHLELLRLDFTRLEFYSPDNSAKLNSILKCFDFKFCNNLKTIRFYSTPLWIESPKTFDFSTLYKCLNHIKTIEVYDNYPEIASVAFGNYFDYSFLHCFPHVKNLKIFQKKMQGRFLHEAACLNETVKVHQFIYNGRIYESNIWKKMPDLQELTFGRKTYNRSSFIQNIKLKIGTQTIQQVGTEPGPSQSVRQSRGVQNSVRVKRWSKQVTMVEMFQCRKCPGKLFTPAEKDAHRESHRMSKRSNVPIENPEL